MLAIYARVSTERQEQAGTIQNQIDSAERYISANAIPKYEKYIDDGISAGSDDISIRPSLVKMMDDIKAGLISAVWAYDISRLARNDQIHAYILSVLKKNKVRLIFNAGEMDLTKPTDSLLASMLGSFAVYEKEQIKIRTMTGRNRKINNGDYSKPPNMYGYEAYKDENGKTRFRINEKEAEILRYVYNGYISGKNLRQMKDYITASGKTGWYNLYSAIKNPAYMGYTYNTTKELIKSNVYQAIVSVEVWNEVNRKIKENGKLWGQQPRKAMFLGSGLIICGYCGKKFYQVNTKKYLYYRHVRLANIECKHTGTTIAKTVYDKILDFVFQYSYKNKLMLRHSFGELQRQSETIDEEKGKEISLLRRTIEENNKKLSNILSAIKKGISAEMFVNEAVSLQDEIKKMETRIEETRSEISIKKNAIEGELEEFKANRLKEYKKADIEEKRKLIIMLIISSIKIENTLIVSTKYNRHFIFDTRGTKQSALLEMEDDELISKMMRYMNIRREDETINAIIEKQSTKPYHYEVYDLRLKEDEIEAIIDENNRRDKELSKDRREAERRA